MNLSMLNVASQSEPKGSTVQVSKRKQQYFVHWARSDQWKAFLAWLPIELHDAPGIDWTKLPSPAMRYCVQTIKNSPDAAILAMALTSVHGAVGTNSSFKLLKDVNILIRDLRTNCKMTHLSDLQSAQIWYDWLATKAKLTGRGTS